MQLSCLKQVYSKQSTEFFHLSYTVYEVSRHIECNQKPVIDQYLMSNNEAEISCSQYTGMKEGGSTYIYVATEISELESSLTHHTNVHVEFELMV